MKNMTHFVAMLVLFAAGRAVAQQPAPVKIEGGLVQGTSDDGVTVYKGIPFAAPPVGELRWRAPQPPAPWEGVLKADTFSANPMQEMRERFGPWTSEYQPQGVVSEDCLYLNVWTAAQSAKEKRPVVMYIPGGAFTGEVSGAMRADFAWPRADKRREFLRVRRNTEGGLELFGNQGSGVLTSTVWADGLVDNPGGTTIAPGDTVRYLPFAELLG